MYHERVEALQEFLPEIRAGNFPHPAQSIPKHEGEMEKLREALDML